MFIGEGTSVEMDGGDRVNAKDTKENRLTRYGRVPNEVLSVRLLISTGVLQPQAHNLIKHSVNVSIN